jgi:hypothetical protein
MQTSSIPYPPRRQRHGSRTFHAIGLVLLLTTLGTSCRDEEPALPKNIIYAPDGRSVMAGEPDPIFLDMNGDGTVDFTVFVELTANTSGDHLYAGINPIGPHLIKSGPPEDDRFLNMGFLVAEVPGTTIDESLGPEERWSGDHGTLVIRHTPTTGAVWYEGDWSPDSAQIVGIQLMIGGEAHYGWLRLRFDKSTERLTLVDHAHVETAELPLKAGEH